MNTWKNNNALTRFKESYFLEDVDNKKSGLPTDAKPVGGIIFYIDDAAEGKYEFFDVDGNVIENVQVGDKPYAYRVVSAGSEDKYYVYHDRLYEGRWTYYKNRGRVNESLGTSTGIGAGKTNTEKVMAKDNGAYITADSRKYPTIWYQLQQVRNAKAGGCDDWFVPSKDELEKLRLAIKSGGITGGTVAWSSYNSSVFMNRYLWPSSEAGAQTAWGWDPNHQYWFSYYKYYGSTVLFTRAF